MAFGTSVAKRLRQKIVRFGRDKGGQMVLTAGLVGAPMMGAVGLSVDYARKSDALALTQAALDGAAMAATSALSAGETMTEATAQANTFFSNNRPQTLDGDPVVGVALSPTGDTIVASVQAKVPTTLLKIIGIDYMHLGGATPQQGVNNNPLTAEVSLPAFTPEHRGEIVFVMDYSGSMNWSLGGEKKYKTMRNEAAKLVNALSSAKTNQYVKFGVVPFSGEVFATMKKKYWYGYKGNANRSSCTRDRKYPYNLSDATPTHLSWKKHKTHFGQVHQTWSPWGMVPKKNPYHWLWYQGWDNYRYNCNGYSGWRNLEVQDLTSNHNDTYNKILAMSPYGSTHIALGMEFGWHLLSPNAPFTAGVAYGTQDTEKAIILLTDGAQTTRAFGSGSSYSVSKGEQNLATICTKIKNKGIRILTISYDLYNYQTEQRLKNCASKDSDFYDANSRDELVAAFSGITAKLARDMFLAK